MSGTQFKVGDRVQLSYEPDDNNEPGVIVAFAPNEEAVVVRCEDGLSYMASELRLLPPLSSDTPSDTPAEPIVHDAVNHPNHYVSHPSGVECIQITEHMGFNLGNATKYVWRADLKENALEDLRKACWYIQREIALRERKAAA